MRKQVCRSNSNLLRVDVNALRVEKLCRKSLFADDDDEEENVDEKQEAAKEPTEQDEDTEDYEVDEQVSVPSEENQNQNGITCKRM